MFLKKIVEKISFNESEKRIEHLSIRLVIVFTQLPRIDQKKISGCNQI